MEATNFEETLKQLETRVDKLSGIPSDKPKSTQFFSFKGININKRIFLWIGIPVAIMAALMVFKPKIVREEITDEDGTVYEKVSKKRVFIGTLFITALIIGGYFVWKYKKSVA
jgi:hypothetical protein